MRAFENNNDEVEARIPEEDLDNYNPNAPWESYTDREGKVICTESSSSRISLYMALLFFGLSYPIAIQMPFDKSSDEFFVFAVRSICPLIGGLSLIHAVRSYIRMKKFGISSFYINDKTGFLGGALTGSIKTTVEVKPNKDYTVSLECLETKVSSGSSGSSQTRHVVLWKGSNKIPRMHFKSTEGMPVSFNLPADLPESNNIGGHGHISWFVRIFAQTPGLNYNASFSVPVFRKRS
jgi:hypothetical protein